MKNRIITMLFIVMCAFLTACGKGKTGENPVNVTEENVIEEAVTNENVVAAQAIIALTESYNTTDNAYDEEIGYEKSKELFLKENDEEAYQLILDDLEEKTGSAQKQVEKFYANIDTLFTEKCTTFELGVDDSVLFYYYHNLTKNYIKAYDWVVSGAIGGGVNLHSDQEGATHAAGGDWIYYGEMTMYLPYYIYENLNADKEISIKDMVNEIGFMDRSTSCLANMNYDDAYDNNDWDAYEYSSVRERIPMMASMMWMGRKYETFDGLAEHELIFTPSIVTTEDYWKYDWFDGTVTCAYVIHFYDKTADLYGEAGFTETNKLMGISFWEEPDTVFWNTDKAKEEEVKTQTENDIKPEEEAVADKSATVSDPVYEDKVMEENTPEESVYHENNSTTITTNVTANNSSGGIVFEHIHTWERVTEKVSDGYSYQELVQKGYNCGICNTVFEEYSAVCPGCAAECINNNYVLEDRQAPTVYWEFDLCRSCGSTANGQLIEK